MTKKIMLIAGELSGDMHGAYLVNAIKQISPGASFVGIGGPRMKKAGVELIMDIIGKSTIGMLGNMAVVVANLPSLMGLISKVRSMFIYYKPDVLVLIDNQGMNMFFAKMAKKFGIKSVYYIPPQEWLWGSEKGGRNVIAAVDKIIAILEKEYEFYNRLGDNVEYFGHPLLDIVPSHFQEQRLVDKNEKIIGLFPGSRRQEVSKFSSILKKIAGEVCARDQNYSFMVAISDKMYEDHIKKAFSGANYPLTFHKGTNYEVISKCKAIVGASGTLALECVMMNTPMAVIYKLPTLDYFFAKNIMRIKLDYVSLPNIIMDEMVLPEFIQGEIHEKNIAGVLLEMCGNHKFAEEFDIKAGMIKNKLGKPGVLANIAKAVLNF